MSPPSATRALWTVAVALTVVASVSLVVVSEARGRSESVAVAAARATVAVQDARRAEATLWAPEELLAAESALRDGLAARRQQEARLWILPDFSTALSRLGAAEVLSGRAIALATTRRAAAQETADAEIARADEAVGTSGVVVDSVHLSADRRRLLTNARLALDEARVFRREGDYPSATAAALRARDLAGRVRDHAAALAARYADASVRRTWDQWKAETIEWSRRERRPAIVVSKEGHRLTLYLNGRPAHVYEADMGFNWIADKVAAGDGATPEGRYRITARKTRGATIYYKALLLDYPNAEDRREFARARERGEVSRTAVIGDLIEIHGEGGRGRDWTRGCVALANEDIDELFRYVEVGTPVTIIGTDGPGALAALVDPDREGGESRRR
jgi:lipoprotein-anchoring transpeptidase ErfK/SrfK